MKKLNILKKRIKDNEGYRSKSYLDKLGFLTIGYGHLIKKNENFLLNGVFKKKYLNTIFDKDFEKAKKQYLSLYKKKLHTDDVKEVLIEMIFQMGIKNQKKFIKMNKYIQKQMFFMAAFEMKNSLWYKQTPKRVDCLIKILLKQYYGKQR